MKYTLILHVGMHKTGTSSIQQTLAKFYGQPTKEIVYFNFDGIINHSCIVYPIFLENPYSYRDYGLMNLSFMERHSSIQYLQKTFFTTIKNQRRPISIISGEDISLLSEKELENLKDFLQNFFHEIKVIAYVREPYSFLSSYFQEIVRGLGYKQFKLYSEWIDYKNIFIKFYNVFGEENVFLFRFDPKRDVVLHFCQIFDIPIEPQQTLRIYEGCTKEAIQILYLYNKSLPDYKQNNIVLGWIPSKDSIKRRLVIRSIVEKIGKIKFRIHKHVLDPIVNEKTNEIEWIEERLKEPLIKEGELKHFLSKECVKSEIDLLNINKETIQELKDKIFEIFGKDDKERIAKILNLLYQVIQVT
ncbi:hypothetical protein DRN69_08610 [Candidatus Pacearchaeota archaeon]|nr:MAG: hypothetical protein DRN69_08610 [Candidatus Pacearchaeota archaeon]